MTNQVRRCATRALRGRADLPTVLEYNRSVKLATRYWVHWFNELKLLGPLGYVPPAEAEANYCRQSAEQVATAA